ncbi:TolC family protein [Pedobacter sp. KR3-3]|uniref:TolC family protein n=1 Tax=Pedobacter albus TaxID=3113905 RepID=A0ABU7I8Q4_9SPHI|nr:TolC family protein [Pedobacter sp. KR3-3]MEE1945857.1 TolC family protein [Pedobacter sp. KR3-3]
MKPQLYILLFCLSWIIPAQAQQKDTTASFSLQEAISFALTHQVDVKNAKIDEQIASNTVKKTFGIGLPQVSASADFNDFLKVATSLVPAIFFDKDAAPGTFIPVQFGVKYNSTAGINASQLLFDGTYLVGLRASKTYKELSTKNSARTRIETAVAVTKAYYSVLVSGEQLTLLDANIASLKKSLNDTEAMFKNGFAEKIDADRLSVLYNNAQTERENVVRMLALNLNLLKFQMGLTVNSNLTLKDKIGEINVDQTPVLSDSSAYHKRIEYSILQTQLKLNELDVKRYKSAFLPSLSAFGSYSLSFQNDRFADLYDKNFPTSVIGLKLSIPIISGGQKLYDVRNAKLEVLKTQNNINNLANSINLEVSQAQTNFLNGQKSLQNQKRNMALAQEVLRVTKIKYEQGVGTNLEVTTAETSLKEAQNNYINALYDMLINKVNLDKALGNINY